VHESLQATLKESQKNETKIKKELETNHAQAMTEMKEKLKTSDDRVRTLASKLKSSEAKAKAIDKIIFRKKCYVL
jgi:ATP phosphoribosyltransferase regulatory subunit HisZ